MSLPTRFKVVDVTFRVHAADDMDTVFEQLERDLPERLWNDQGVHPSWDTATRVFTVTVFERAFEDRAGVVRLIHDMGYQTQEAVAWL